MNFVHVHRKWSEALCHQGQYEGSRDVLLAGQRDLAAEPWFDQALLDVYRRWSMALVRQGRAEAALALLDRAMARHPHPSLASDRRRILLSEQAGSPSPTSREPREMSVGSSWADRHFISDALDAPMPDSGGRGTSL